uniref:Uncharacterized protein n=1 Tax=Arundo donax TaxID=35708 RepID=A0A0A9EJ68_ARUDO
MLCEEVLVAGYFVAKGYLAMKLVVMGVTVHSLHKSYLPSSFSVLHHEEHVHCGKMCL